MCMSPFFDELNRMLKIGRRDKVLLWLAIFSRKRYTIVRLEIREISIQKINE